MSKTLLELAEMVGGRVEGDGSLVITGLSGVAEAREGEITFLTNPKYRSRILTTRAAAVVASEAIEGLQVSFLITPEPYLAYAKLARFFFQKSPGPRGVSPQAVLSAGVRIGRDVSISPFVFVGENVRLGDRVILFPGVFVGDDSRIGDDAVIHANVTIREGSVIGNRVILHPGVVIGSDGFGYAREKGKSFKVPQVGIVQIDDDVEIGANTTVDRAALGKTWIKRGVKIDNLVMVAHNVTIGEDSIIVAQSGIAGSSELGDRVIMAAQSGVAGHLKIGDNVTLGGRAGITKNIEAGSIVSGIPGIPHQKWLRAQMEFNRLPELRKELHRLQSELKALEQQLAERKKP